MSDTTLPIYIQIKEVNSVAKSESEEATVVYDLDSNGELVGIEIITGKQFRGNPFDDVLPAKVFLLGK